jgi:DNA-binding Lrp family transcriptional regulator
MRIELDSTDLQILHLLQTDASVGQAVVGKRVGLSTAAVNRRIRRLTDAGVITRTSAVLDGELLGHAITLVVQIEVESEQPELLSATEAALSADARVQQCYYVTGEADFIVVVVVQSMSEYTELTKQLFFSNNNVKKFKTFVVMRSSKASLNIPLV